MEKRGKVVIAGAGPGDPELITLKCKKVIEQADVIIYDHLIPHEVLLLAKNGAEKIYVGKEAGKQVLSQDEINNLMVEKAKEGKLVLRLKGGDPFIFGRGGEECEFLRENNVDFEVIPGISSFYSVPAYAGIPLTHREFVSSFAVATGSEAKTGEVTGRLDFNALSKTGTIVFLMTVKNLQFIVENLLKYLNPSTPSAIIENGTTPMQRVIYAPLKDIVQEAKSQKVKPPAIFIVGDVVKLREKIMWFERKPLFGVKVLITRPIHQSLKFAELIREEGGNPILFPSVEIKVDEKHRENIKMFLDEIRKNSKQEGIVVFTSQNGVRVFFDEMFSSGFDARIFHPFKIAVIGEKTSAEIKKYGIIPDIVPENFSTSGLLKELLKAKEKKVFILRAEGVRNIEEKLKESGKEVENIDIYRIEEVKHTQEEIKEIIDISPDILTFTSSLSFEAFAKQFPHEWIYERKIACIGNVTAKTVEKIIGKKPEIISEKESIESLTEAIKSFVAKEKR